MQTLHKIRSGEMQEGLTLNIPAIDDYIRYKPSNFNVILGHANVGKTTLVLYLMLSYSQKHNKRWLVYSAENEPYGIIRKLIEFMSGKTIFQISDEELKICSEYVNAHFKFVSNDNMYTYSELIKLAKAIKAAWDYHGLLIDPYNALIKDNNLLKSLGGHEYDYQACTEIRMFCKEHQVTTWLNTHANTTALRLLHRIDHEYSGYPIPPMASDVEGGGKFVNRADDFWVLHRYTQHPSEWMYSHLHVRKVKEIETGGRPTMLDNPIKFRAVVNNVGFTCEGVNILDNIALDKS